MLEETIKIIHASLQHKTGFNMDIGGNAVLTNGNGNTAQIAFGADNRYKCGFEVWSSTSTICSDSGKHILCV